MFINCYLIKAVRSDVERAVLVSLAICGVYSTFYHLFRRNSRYEKISSSSFGKCAVDEKTRKKRERTEIA